MSAPRNSLTQSDPSESERCADEIERLIAELRARGVDFLTGRRDAALDAEVTAHPLEPAHLLVRLAACAEPSVRDATIALLLLHPELSAHLPHPLATPTDAATQQLAVLALAAAYLRRQWWTRLALALGDRTPVSVSYWRTWQLPDPDGDSALGLSAPATRERERTGRPVNYLAMWQQQVDHLTSQAWRARRRARRVSDEAQHGVAPVAPSGSQPHDSAGAMGMPHAPRARGGSARLHAPADRERIERFLTRLGAAVPGPGRIDLVGGTTMVFEGFRATTVDIDLLVEADNPGSIVAAVRDLKDALDINVEFASPRDFIPLPVGWRERSIYIGRYGPLDVFHFDLYSMALSKVERGTERDFQDVVALVRSGRIDPTALDTAFHEVLPRVATEGMAGMDPAVFTEHYRYLQSLLMQQP